MDVRKCYTPPHLIQYPPNRIPETVIKLFPDNLPTPAPAKSLVPSTTLADRDDIEIIESGFLKASPNP